MSEDEALRARFEAKRSLFEQLYDQYAVQYGILGLQTFDDHLAMKRNEYIDYDRLRDLPFFFITSTDQRLFDDFGYLAPLIIDGSVHFISPKKLAPIKLGINLETIENINQVSILNYSITDISTSFWTAAGKLFYLDLRSLLSFQTVPDIPMDKMEKLKLGISVDGGVEPLSLVSNIDLEWIARCKKLASLTLHTVNLDVFDPSAVCQFVYKLKLFNGTMSRLPSSYSRLINLTHLTMRNMCFTEFPIGVLGSLKSLTHINFSNFGGWPNENDFSSAPIIIDERLINIQHLELFHAHVKLLYFTSESQRFKALTHLYVTNLDLDDQYTTNVWEESPKLITKLEEIVTAGKWVSPTVLRQKHLRDIGTGYILMPTSSNNFNYYRIAYTYGGDDETNAAFELFQSISLHNNDVTSNQFSMEGYDPLEYDSDDETEPEELKKQKAERWERNKKEKKESNQAFNAFSKMLDEVKQIARLRREQIFDYAKIRVKLTPEKRRSIPTINCDADRAARKEFEQGPPRVFDSTRLDIIRETQQQEPRPAFLKSYYLNRLVGLGVIPLGFGTLHTNVPINTNNETEQGIYNKFIENFKSLYKTAFEWYVRYLRNNAIFKISDDQQFKRASKFRIEQIASCLIDHALEDAQDDVVRNVRLQSISDGTYTFTDDEIQVVIDEIDDAMFQTSQLIARRMDEEKVLLQDASEDAKRQMLQDVLYSFGNLNEHYMTMKFMDFDIVSINFERASSATFERLIEENNVVGESDTNLLIADLPCRKFPLFPFTVYFESEMVTAASRFLLSVFGSPLFQEDCRWYFEKKIRMLYAEQQADEARWALQHETIQREFDVSGAEIREQQREQEERQLQQARAENERRIREDAEELGERMIVEEQYRKRIEDLRIMAQTDPAAFAEYQAQIAREAAAEHEMRDPTIEEVSAALARIEKTVKRRVPFYIASSPPPDQNCFFCFEPFDLRNQEHVPSTEHHEIFNPLRREEDYGMIIVTNEQGKEEERYPGKAAVVCNFVKSDFPQPDVNLTEEEKDAMKKFTADQIEIHHTHFFHYYCAANALQSQQEFGQPYKCIAIQDAVFGLGN